MGPRGTNRRLPRVATPEDPLAALNTPLGAMNELVGRFEPALTLASGLAGSSPAGLRGLAGVVSGETTDQASEGIRQVQGNLTWQPRTELGQQGVSALADTLTQAGRTIGDAVPVLDPAWRGQQALDLTGSPLVAALADTVDPLDLISGGTNLAIMAGARGANRLFNSSLRDPSALQAIQLAQRLEDAGEAPEAIWRATGDHFRQAGTPWAGVVRGVDGEWRFEIPDGAARILEGPAATSPLGEVLSHPQLFDAYPLARENTSVKFDLDMPEGSGSFLAAHGDAPDLIRVSNWGDPQGSLLDNLLHETQHGVQNAEGFARGGSPGEFAAGTMTRIVSTKKALDDLRVGESFAKWYKPDMGPASPELAARFAAETGTPLEHAEDALMAFWSGTRETMDPRVFAERTREYQQFLDGADPTGYTQYQALAGEAEARQTVARRHLTTEQRRDRFPDLDFDVPRDQQQVIRGNDMPQLSAPRISQKDSLLLAQELETGRGGLAELLSRRPDLQEYSRAQVPDSGATVPLFRAVSVQPGQSLRPEATVSTSTTAVPPVGMLRNAPALFTRDGLVVTDPHLLRYDAPREQVQGYVPALIDLVSDTQPAMLERKLTTRSGERMRVGEVFDQVRGEDEVLVDVAGQPPSALISGADLPTGVNQAQSLSILADILAGRWAGSDALLRDLRGSNTYFEDPAAARRMFDHLNAKAQPFVLGGDPNTRAR